MKKISVLLVVAALCVSMIAFTGCSAAFDAGRDIVVVTREEGSGTRDAFLEKTGVTNETHKKDGVITYSSTGEVYTKVLSDSQSIGYISAGSAGSDIKILSLKNTDGSIVECTEANIKSGSYALARPFNLVTDITKEPAGWMKDFLNYILSKTGQDIVKAEKYIALDNAPAYSKISSLPASGTIKIGGSTSVAPLMERLKEEYLKLNAGVTITIEANGSGAGITGAKNGTYDIGMASKAVSDAALTSRKLADDGIAVIVNKKNDALAAITIENLAKIYKGEIKIWKELA